MFSLKRLVPVFVRSVSHDHSPVVRLKTPLQRQIYGRGVISRVSVTTLIRSKEVKRKLGCIEKSFEKIPVTHFAVQEDDAGAGSQLIFLRSTDKLAAAMLSEVGDIIFFTASATDGSGEFELTFLRNSTLESIALRLKASSMPRANALFIRNTRLESEYETLGISKLAFYEAAVSRKSECLNYLALVDLEKHRVLYVRASESSSAHLMHAVADDAARLPVGVMPDERSYYCGDKVELILNAV